MKVRTRKAHIVLPGKPAWVMTWEPATAEFTVRKRGNRREVWRVAAGDLVTLVLVGTGSQLPLPFFGRPDPAAAP